MCVSVCVCVCECVCVCFLCVCVCLECTLVGNQKELLGVGLGTKNMSPILGVPNAAPQAKAPHSRADLRRPARHKVDHARQRAHGHGKFTWNTRSPEPPFS